MKKTVIYAVICAVLLLLAVLAVKNALTDDVPGSPGGEVIPVSGSDASKDYPFQVYFADVWQGDGIVIKNKNVFIVVDGGDSDHSYAVTGILDSLGAKDIELYIATHPHSDHIGAAGDIFEKYNVKNVMMTSFSEFNTPTTITYEKLLSAVENEKCGVILATAGDSFTYGDMKLDVFSPSEETAEYNNMSIVFKLTCGKTRFLFTGDAEKAVDEQLLASDFDLGADVLKIAHHGGSDATSKQFLEAVSPKTAVISCGKNNDYGHPHRETLKLLESEDIEVLRTDERGDITIFSDGKNIFVKE
ncbi:MAG: MBL fold metallo-hydrolase [Clostridia bacterium]|nr:MBL fold metallo-hydrolase [Clostridia bacterium]